MKPIHHSGSIIFRPLGVLALGRSMHVRRVITLALTMCIEYDRKVGHNSPRLWKQLVGLPGLSTVQPVHAAIKRAWLQTVLLYEGSYRRPFPI